MARTYTIELSLDSFGEEAAHFAAFLRSYGHFVTLGLTTRTYIDGIDTTNSVEAGDWISAMWGEYCGNHTTTGVENHG